MRMSYMYYLRIRRRMLRPTVYEDFFDMIPYGVLIQCCHEAIGRMWQYFYQKVTKFVNDKGLMYKSSYFGCTYKPDRVTLASLTWTV